MKYIWLLTLIIVLLFNAGCLNKDIEGNEGESNEIKQHGKDTEVRKVVLDYMEQEEWYPEHYPINDWENALVKKVTADDKNKTVDKKYIGKEIFAVTIEDAIAAPTVFVDPVSLKIIGIMPGE